MRPGLADCCGLFCAANVMLPQLHFLLGVHRVRLGPDIRRAPLHAWNHRLSSGLGIHSHQQGADLNQKLPMWTLKPYSSISSSGLLPRALSPLHSGRSVLCGLRSLASCRRDCLHLDSIFARHRCLQVHEDHQVKTSFLRTYQVSVAHPPTAYASFTCSSGARSGRTAGISASADRN